MKNLWVWLRAETEGRDVLAVVGVALISVGLWLLFSLALASIVVGALLLYLGLWHSALFAKVTSKVE